MAITTLPTFAVGNRLTPVPGSLLQVAPASVDRYTPASATDAPGRPIPAYAMFPLDGSNTTDVPNEFVRAGAVFAVRTSVQVVPPLVDRKIPDPKFVNSRTDASNI